MRDEDDWDLFSALSPGDAGKREGMERVDAHADDQWKAEMFRFAVAVTRRQRFFTSDDVFDLALASGMTATTHDERAFGPIMLRLAKAGYCRKANCAPVNSRRASLHSSPRCVWESLVYGRTAETIEEMF